MFGFSGFFGSQDGISCRLDRLGTHSVAKDELWIRPASTSQVWHFSFKGQKLSLVISGEPTWSCLSNWTLVIFSIKQHYTSREGRWGRVALVSVEHVAQGHRRTCPLESMDYFHVTWDLDMLLASLPSWRQYSLEMNCVPMKHHLPEATHPCALD